MVTVLNKQQITLIERIIKLSTAIYSLYESLYAMELNNEKDTEFYNKTLKKLETFIEIEKDLYKELQNSACLIDDFIDYIDQAKYFSYFTDYHMLMNVDRLTCIKKHIYNILSTLKEQEKLEEIYESKIFNVQEIPHDIIIYITNQIHDDIEKIFLYLTEKAISNSEFEDYRKRLLKLKYLLVFLNSRLSDLRTNNFNIPTELNLYSKSLKSILNLEDYDYSSIINEYLLYYLEPHIKSLSANQEEDYKDNEKYFNIIIEYLITLAFLEISPDDKKSLKDTFYDIIKEDINNFNITKLFDTWNNQNIDAGIKIIELKGINNDKSSRRF